MNKQTNIPELRFPEFKREWKEYQFQTHLSKIETGTNKLGSEDFSGLPLLKMGNIHRGNFSFNKLEKLKKDEVVNKKHLIQNKDFLFNTRNTMELVGKSATWRGESNKFAFNSNIARLTLENIDTVFFNYLYNTPKLIHRVKSLAVGTTSVAAIYPRDLKKLKYSIPIFDEQLKIGELFSKLDRQIELEEKKLELLEQQKREYMQKIFTQELRFKDKNGNAYTNWRTIELKNILEKVIDNRGKTPDNSSSEKYPLLEVNALGYYHPSYKKVSKFVSESTYNNWFREHLKENDILFSTVGNTGIVSLMDGYKAVIAQNIVGLRVNSNNLPAFVYYMLSYWENQKKIKRIQMGAVQPSVKVSQFKFIKYLVPIKDEQEKIANLLSEIDKIINKQLIKIELLKQRKKGLLQKMFV